MKNESKLTYENIVHEFAFALMTRWPSGLRRHTWIVVDFDSWVVVSVGSNPTHAKVFVRKFVSSSKAN